MFLKTLGIGEKTVAYTLQHRLEIGHAAKDRRKKHPPAHKIPDSIRRRVHQHIESFSAMESHYARSKYRDCKKFLQKDLNIAQMYRLHCEAVASEPENMVNEKYYRGVLHTDFPHLSFHKPKKDECSFCFSFKNMKDDEKACTSLTITNTIEENAAFANSSRTTKK